MIDLDSLAATELAALSPRERSLASALLDTAAQWMPQSVRDARIRAVRERRDRFIDPLELPVAARHAYRVARVTRRRMLGRRKELQA